MRGRKKGYKMSEETKAKLRVIHLGTHFTPEVNKKKGRPGVINPFYGKKHTEQTKQHLREINLGRRWPAEVNAKKGLKGELNPWYGKHYSGGGTTPEAARRLWDDPEYVQMMMRARKARPNKTEKYLDTLLQQNFPGEWRYTGDGRDGTTIGRHIPDFLNVNGRKAVIELFGERWHSPLANPSIEWNRTAEETIKHYRKYGMSCIIVWDSELRSNPEGVVERLREWRW